MAIFKSFIFDNIKSLDHGIYITGEAVYNAPQRVVDMISVPGRNGDIAIDQGRFENIDVKFPAGAYSALHTQEDFAQKIMEIRNLLASRYTYKRLVDEYHPDEYRMGVYKSGLEVDPVAYSSAGEFDIVFDCKPQRWLLSGEEAQTFTSSGTIENPTLFEAKPLLAVTGGGILTLGSGVMTIIERASASSVIYIDCESQEAWEEVGGAKASRNDYIQNAGEQFPVLRGGENTVNLGTGITKVEITPRWWRI